MISRPSTVRTESGRSDSTLQARARRPQNQPRDGEAFGSRSPGSARSFAGARGGKQVALFLTILAASCVLAVVVGTLGQMRATQALEARLTAEEARGLAGKLDSIIQTRAAAMGMAAGGLDIEHLGARGGLERLLNHLKESFPDFLSLEVLNEQGQALAMMGDLSLSQAGRKPKLDAAAETAAAGQPGTVGFQDDPRQQCFCLTLRHGGSDTVTWYSRTTFSRKPIDLAMVSAGNEGHVALEARPSATANAMGSPNATPTVNVKKGWLASTFFAEVPLGVPGWKVTVERFGTRAGFSLFALIVPCLMLLVAGAAVWSVKKTDSVHSPWNEARHDDMPLTPEPLTGTDPAPADQQALEAFTTQLEEGNAQSPPDSALPESEPDSLGDDLLAAASPPSPGFEDETAHGVQDSASDATQGPSTSIATPAPAEVELLTALALPLQPPVDIDIPDTLDIEWTEAPVPAQELAEPVEDVCSPAVDEDADSLASRVSEAIEVAWAEAPSAEEIPKKTPRRRTKRANSSHQTEIPA